MPLPLFLGIGAAIAGATGVATGIHGAVKMKNANDTMKSAEAHHKENIDRFEKQNKATSLEMDRLGTLELEILKSFDEFADLFERIQNRPVFEEYTKEGVALPKYDAATLRTVSVGAGVLLGGLGGAAVGTAGGFAAAGATTSAVMALGTASTGTAIASLSGAAATNATLAALGGGAIAAGGGGMALGTTILGVTTLGVGILVGGVIFNITGNKLSDKADEAWEQMKKVEKQIINICTYLNILSHTAYRYRTTMNSVKDIYQRHYKKLYMMVNGLNHCDWNHFTEEEKILTKNTVLLVGLLYNMCKVELVLKGGNGEINKVNEVAVNDSISQTNSALTERGIA